ncbi:hypothetical protein J6590_099674 [Homalodisca vitripennis]|nr:hypothetical protein J6590_099674 [Homalodisca vitripennis]
MFLSTLKNTLLYSGYERGNRYEHVLNEQVLPHFTVSEMEQAIFQQDCAPPHFANPVKRLLNDHLTVCDFFLWGYLKEQVYTRSFNNDEELKQSIEQELLRIPQNVFFHTPPKQPTLGRTVYMIVISILDSLIHYQLTPTYSGRLQPSLEHALISSRSNPTYIHIRSRVLQKRAEQLCGVPQEPGLVSTLFHIYRTRRMVALSWVITRPTGRSGTNLRSVHISVNAGSNLGRDAFGSCSIIGGGGRQLITTFALSYVKIDFVVGGLDLCVHRPSCPPTDSWGQEWVVSSRISLPSFKVITLVAH